jgi:hypothetical protein
MSLRGASNHDDRGVLPTAIEGKRERQSCTWATTDEGVRSGTGRPTWPPVARFEAQPTIGGKMFLASLGKRVADIVGLLGCGEHLTLPVAQEFQTVTHRFGIKRAEEMQQTTNRVTDWPLARYDNSRMVTALPQPA